MVIWFDLVLCCSKNYSNWPYYHFFRSRSVTLLPACIVWTWRSMIDSLNQFPVPPRGLLQVLQLHLAESTASWTSPGLGRHPCTTRPHRHSLSSWLSQMTIKTTCHSSLLTQSQRLLEPKLPCMLLTPSVLNTSMTCFALFENCADRGTSRCTWLMSILLWLLLHTLRNVPLGDTTPITMMLRTWMIWWIDARLCDTCAFPCYAFRASCTADVNCDSVILFVLWSTTCDFDNAFTTTCYNFDADINKFPIAT